jgi:hypothetical protein
VRAPLAQALQPAFATLEFARFGAWLPLVVAVRPLHFVASGTSSPFHPSPDPNCPTYAPGAFRNRRTAARRSDFDRIADDAGYALKTATKPRGLEDVVCFANAHPELAQNFAPAGVGPFC